MPPPFREPDRPTEEIQAALGHRFRHPELLEAALTHRSWAVERPDRPEDNQRLEFLGDAVLQIVVTEHLYRTRPDWSEGRLTQVRSIFARGETLARLAAEIGLGAHVRVGRGEDRTEGPRSSILTDALEAVFGAVYLDGGIRSARKVILRLMRRELDALDGAPPERNPKGHLQEWLQSSGRGQPVYRTVETAGPDHERRFRVEVSVAGEVLAEGTGRSKKTAEMTAASAALREAAASDPGKTEGATPGGATPGGADPTVPGDTDQGTADRSRSTPSS